MYISVLQLSAEKYMKTSHWTYIKYCFYVLQLKTKDRNFTFLLMTTLKVIVEDNFKNQYLQCTLLTYILCYRFQSTELQCFHFLFDIRFFY